MFPPLPRRTASGRVRGAVRDYLRETLGWPKLQRNFSLGCHTACMNDSPPAFTVLLVEDDETIKAAVSVIAERCGMQLLKPVASAAEALTAAGRHLPDVVVLNLNLSGVLGVRIVPALLAASPASAIIAISPFIRLRDKVVTSGAVAMFDPEDLRLLDACLRWVLASPPVWGDCPADQSLDGRHLAAPNAREQKWEWPSPGGFAGTN